MKKLFLALIIGFFLVSCAPAQAPQTAEPVVATEIPVEEPSVSTEVPTPVNVIRQSQGTINFIYSYTDVIPRELFSGTDLETESITFKRQADGSWNTADLTPKIEDFGPLFRIYLFKTLANQSGNCGVNTLYSAEEGIPVNKFTVQPVCDNIGEVENVTLTIGLAHCERDNYKNLVCNIDGLHYSLNNKLNKFQFYFEGAYNFTYEDWIRQALDQLGFDPLPENFFDNAIAGQNRVILKTHATPTAEEK